MAATVISAYKALAALGQVIASLVSAYKARNIVSASVVSAYKSIQQMWATLVSAFRTLFWIIPRALPARDLVTVCSTSDLRIPALVSMNTVTALPTVNLSTGLSAHDLLTVLEVSHG